MGGRCGHVTNEAVVFKNHNRVASLLETRDIPPTPKKTRRNIFFFRFVSANTTGDIPEFPMDVESALELLMAADFLDC